MLRDQNATTRLRDAVSCEFSSLRYALMITNGTDGEGTLLRGWDAGVDVDDEDGT
jgi:hypothetical protein